MLIHPELGTYQSDNAACQLMGPLQHGLGYFRFKGLVFFFKEFCLQHMGQLQQSLAHSGLVIALEKVQRQLSFQYLGHMLYPKEISLKKLEIKKDSLQTSNNFQKLLGSIQ